MATDELSARAEEIRQEMVALNQVLGAYASKVDVENLLTLERAKTKTLVRQRERIITLALGGLLAGVVLLTGAGLYLRAGVVSNRATADRAAAAVRQVEQDRVERSRGSCVQFNVNQHNTREAEIVGLVNTFTPLVPPDRQGQLEFFAASLRANVEILLPYRDCSDAGIEAFLKEPPSDPALGGH